MSHCGNIVWGVTAPLRKSGSRRYSLGMTVARRTPAADGASPAMAQWFALKEQHPDALLFFRMGDFYEMFFADAEAAASALDIALTARGEHGGEPIAMCGVPVHAAESYLARLIRRGFRVAVAEQMEDPKLRSGKAPIRRDIVRLITPGTLTEESLLEAGRPNLLVALAYGGERMGAAWVDVSTGLFETEPLAITGVATLLGRLDPAEVLAPPTLPLGEWEVRRGPLSDASPPLASRRRLAEAFSVASLDALGDFSDGEVVAAMAALDYVRETQAGKMPLLGRPRPQGEAGRLELDAATRASLEITRSRDGGTLHTLLASVQRTQTAAGARLLSGWLSAPLLDLKEIARRQDAWSWLLANDAAAVALRAALRGAPDIARALGRLSLGRGGPRDLAALRDGLRAAKGAAAELVEPVPAVLDTLRTALSVVPDLRDLLGAALADPVPARADEGAVAAGFDAELDAERGLRDDSRRVIASLQLDYAQRYGVASLKIKHHAQLGYVIEVAAPAVEKLRAHPDLTLRQGMANGARFSSAELSDLDRRISEAADRAAARERTVVAHLVACALEQAEALGACAAALAALDVAQSCARLAAGGAWCRPVLSDDGAFRIEAGRHPVVEAALAGSASFVPNGCDLSPDRRVLLLTGPNMAGKSTFLRQNALMVILAQAGLPVPAASAHIGLVDRLFSRVGAADDLARGRSTFMVEMTETASILNLAGPRSLVVVDEIGRGTATLDGLAIAWAVLEALHNQSRCRVIFATHFHELSHLTAELPRLRPHTMRVKEWRSDVVFLHEVAEGAAGRSWGVHVAKLAGVPAPVVRRAAVLLTALEAQAGRLTDAGALPLFAASVTREAPASPDAAASVSPCPSLDAVRDSLTKMDPDLMTPREAHDALYRLRALLPVVPRSNDVT
jgi:DNA mismatch repair protein MutS